MYGGKQGHSLTSAVSESKQEVCVWRCVLTGVCFSWRQTAGRRRLVPTGADLSQRRRPRQSQTGTWVSVCACVCVTLSLTSFKCHQSSFMKKKMKNQTHSFFSSSSVFPVHQHFHADLRHAGECRRTREVLQGYGQDYGEVHTHTHTHTRASWPQYVLWKTKLHLENRKINSHLPLSPTHLLIILSIYALTGSIRCYFYFGSHQTHK